jgi:hypothetical protein
VAESAGEQRRGMRTDLISILWTVSPLQGRIAAQTVLKERPNELYWSGKEVSRAKRNRVPVE